jgi:transposase/uncharacterized protein YlaI
MRKISISKDLLLELYVEQGLNTYQISEELGTSRQTICNKLSEYNIERKTTRYQSKPKEPKLPKKVPKYTNKEDFQKVYSELKSIGLVAEYYNISADTAYSWKKKHGIATIKQISYMGSQKRIEGKPWANKEYLANMYDKYSTYELAKMWNCDPSTIQIWIRKYGIPVKTYSEQWDRKSKSGARILKKDGFDLQEYNKTYALSGCRMSKKVIEDIKKLVGKCQCCGEKEVLDLHHINENPKDNRPENHVILCPNCHARVHRLNKPVRELCPNLVSWDKLVDTYAEAK